MRKLGGVTRGAGNTITVGRLDTTFVSIRQVARSGLHVYCDWAISPGGVEIGCLTDEGRELLLRLDTRLSELPFLA